MHFNSHAHVERDKSQKRIDAETGHFNSHAHVERDVLTYSKNSDDDISTHTLTWSVTTSVI